jgi:alpha-beta hydrolase superfamily lysophospholipase
MAARLWAERGIATYAYDQRGFGEAARPGIWPGGATLVADATTAIALLRARHPGLPLYLLGESMGGAVAIATLGRDHPPAVDGAILAAPAVGSRNMMTLPQRVGLWASVRLVPGWRMTGEGLDIQASDNLDVLQALWEDPLVIKETRVDTIDGLVELMAHSLPRVDRLPVPTLVLFGDREEVLPPAVIEAVVERLGGRHRVAHYPEGWHMLLRDLQAGIVHQDILAWIADAVAPLPSGADRRSRVEASRP